MPGSAGAQPEGLTINDRIRRCVYIIGAAFQRLHAVEPLALGALIDAVREVNTDPAPQLWVSSAGNYIGPTSDAEGLAEWILWRIEDEKADAIASYRKHTVETAVRS
ncbi:MAG: hypothetical protein KF773_26435 [Deltaproteobacteria bacterium]|nr:hypothetical protein [Deltaproteobacteria bacterium]